MGPGTPQTRWCLSGVFLLQMIRHVRLCGYSGVLSSHWSHVTIGSSQHPYVEVTCSWLRVYPRLDRLRNPQGEGRVTQVFHSVFSLSSTRVPNSKLQQTRQPRTWMYPGRCGKERRKDKKGKSSFYRQEMDKVLTFSFRVFNKLKCPSVDPTWNGVLLDMELRVGILQIYFKTWLRHFNNHLTQFWNPSITLPHLHKTYTLLVFTPPSLSSDTTLI